MKSLIFILSLSLFQTDLNEVQWSARLANEMTVEVIVEYKLPDGTRIDIWETKRNICWEVEWVTKSDAAFGQSARYAQQTGGTAGVWLLMKPGDDEDTSEH